MHVVMMGGLYIKMALWNTLGDVLEASCWTDALTEAEVASSGIADSFLKVAHQTCSPSHPPHSPETSEGGFHTFREQ